MYAMIKKNHLMKMMPGTISIVIKFCYKVLGSTDLGIHRFGILEG